jgi:Ca2+-binding EF-hand superfamily protein
MKPHVLAAIVLLGVPLAAGGQTRQGQTMRFRAMDANGDGVISRSEWRGSDQSFRVHDWNNDGILSGAEVRVGANREIDPEEDDYNQGRFPEFRNWTPRGFQILDRDSDGRITRAEWTYDRQGFIRADQNRDNVLTRSEFLGTDSDSDREDRFEYLDVNNNGRIERSEWHGSRDAFEWLDRNNDGMLARSEVVGEEEQSDLFSRLDVNGDDRISTSEWRWSRRSFTRQDMNGDGQLTRRELTNAEIDSTAPGVVGTSGRTISVDSTQRWVDTGIDVRRGDTIAIQSTGTVGLSSNASDTAGPGGAARRATAAPLPNQPAGALIARIDELAPMFVGDRSTITANGTGRLYLSVNDDHLGDNHGQFRVTVQQR